MKTMHKGILIIFIYLSCLLKGAAGQQMEYTNPLHPLYDFYMGIDNAGMSAATDSFLTQIGYWAWGPCRAVAAQGNYAYIGNGSTFQVLDFSIPSTPQIISEYYLGATIIDITLRDTLAFLVNGRYLLILNVSNPMMPAKLGELYVPLSPIRVTLSDSLAFVSTFGGQLFVIDISDLSNPYILNSGAGGGMLLWSLASKGRHVYMGSSEDVFLTYYDVTNPDSLQFRWKTFSVGGTVTSAFVKDDYLFLGVWGLTGQEALKIYDISTPDSLIYVSEVTIGARIMAVTANDSLAYLCVPDSGVYAIDIINIAQPQVKGKLLRKAVDSNFGGSSIAVSNSQVYSGYYTGLLVADVSQPDSLVETTFFPTSEISFRITIKDHFAYVASGRAGLWILDISDPAQPRGVANIQTGGFAYDVVVTSSVCYFYSNRLWVYDVSNPSSPQYLTDYKSIVHNPQGFVVPNSLAQDGNLLFLTHTSSVYNDSSLEIIDVSDPLQPNALSVFKMPYATHNLDVKDDIAYLATIEAGLRIVNCQDPYNPYAIATLFENKHVGVVLNENLAYINLPDSFFVADISIPQSPTVLGNLGRSFSGSYFDMAFSDNYVYWVGGPAVIDVSDPYQPDEIAHYGYVSDGVAVKNDVVAITNRTNGVVIFRNSLIPVNVSQYILPLVQKYELYQNYPNPFNPSTEIRYGIPNSGKVTITVFNILGQKIKTLLSQRQTVGEHGVVWDGRDDSGQEVSSGIYFYQLQTGKFKEVKRALLLR